MRGRRGRGRGRHGLGCLRTCALRFLIVLLAAGSGSTALSTAAAAAALSVAGGSSAASGANRGRRLRTPRIGPRAVGAVAAAGKSSADSSGSSGDSSGSSNTPAATTTIEERLAARGIVALNGGSEIRRVELRHVVGMPTPRDLVQQTSWPHSYDDAAAGVPNHERRSRRRLAYVVGGSGSGKTFFATRELRDVGNPTGLPSVTLYLQPGAERGTIGPLLYGPRDQYRQLPEALVGLVQDLVRQVMGTGRRHAKLRMHVCLVFDEAGSSELHGFFHDRQALDRLVDAAVDRIATSVMVVVAGTGHGLGTAHDATDEATVFRMPQWGRRDLEVLLEQQQQQQQQQQRPLALQDGGMSAVKAVVDAVWAEPALAALATNARSAAFLAESLEEAAAAAASLAGSAWIDHFRALAPDLLAKVVAKYANENGLHTLDRKHIALYGKLRVAAWICVTISALNKGSVRPPEFDGLSLDERDVAVSLLQFNVENRRGALQLVENCARSASVTPAIAVILYSLAGTPANVLIALKPLEATASLFAVRNLVRVVWERHMEQVRSLQMSYMKQRASVSLEEFEMTLAREGGVTLNKYRYELLGWESAFGRELKEICLIRLRRKVQRPIDRSRTRSSVASVPRVTNATVLLNGDQSSFADVIAPYMLIQTKSSLEKRTHVDMTKELDNCCLLRDCLDDRVLRGMVVVWDGCFPKTKFVRPRVGKLESIGNNETEQSLEGTAANFENLIDIRSPVNTEPAFMKIDYMSNVSLARRRPKLVLPSLPARRPIEFILFTNAEAVLLNFATFTVQGHSPAGFAIKSITDATNPTRSHVLLVTRDLLDSDLQLSAEKISTSNPWHTFLEQRLREGVNVRFVFV
jgi:hypothetical protein